MKNPLLHRIAILFSAVGLFLFAAPFTFAASFTLSQQYQYQGLTFSNPLNFSQPISYPQPTSSITFNSQNQIVISDANVQKPISGIDVSVESNNANQPMPSVTVIPTPTIYTAPTPTPTTTEPLISVSPTPDQVLQATITPTPAPYSPVNQSANGGLSAAVLFSMVNSYRQSESLPPFQQDAKTCSLAQERAPEIAGEIAAGTMHSGLAALNLPYWNTENIIQMTTNEAAFTWWINDPIHHEAIVGNFTYSCVACSGNDCAEEFTSYQPK